MGEDAASRFFQDLHERGSDPRAGYLRGTVQIEVDDEDHGEPWCVSLNRGALSVSRRATDPDCVVRTDRATLEGLVEGRVNATSALLRGLVEARGDVDLLIALQRLFPSPPGSGGIAAARGMGGAE